MPSIAGTSPAGAHRSFGTLVGVVAPSLAATTSSSDATNACAMAGAGLAALAMLPLLLLASIALGAPLAVPAAIACGYLVISQALAANRPRHAATISAAVLAALMGWLILYLAQGEEPLSRAGMAAALMTPLFAAAPALARSALLLGGARANPSLAMRTAALQRVACLDELAPAEAVVIADHEGAVLAATRAARKRLRLLPEAFDQPLASAFRPSGMPQVAAALRNCRSRGAPVEVAVEDLEQFGATATWVASPSDAGAVSLRLQALAMRAAEEATDAPRCKAAHAPAACACDLGEAIAFALRRARPRGTAMDVTFDVACDSAIMVACDRQIGRRVAHLAIEGALATSRSGGAIRVDARRLKGIVLLRVVAEHADVCDDDGAAAAEFATLRALVDDASGTSIIERNASRTTLSVRLPLFDNATTTTGEMRERAEAS